MRKLLLPKPNCFYLQSDGDVRSSSYDARYAGVVFTGSIEHAKLQAALEPEYSLPNDKAAWRQGINLSRFELLRFLRLV